MMSFYLFAFIAQSALLSEPATAPAPIVTTEIQKEYVYKKETTVDLSGSNVQGQNQLPPAFFVTDTRPPQSGSLLKDRLVFSMKHYNDLGF